MRDYFYIHFHDVASVESNLLLRATMEYLVRMLLIFWLIANARIVEAEKLFRSFVRNKTDTFV